MALQRSSAQDMRLFHEGETAIQKRYGVEKELELLGSRMIHPILPEQHRRFYENLRFVFAGSIDNQGRPWASVIQGNPGFVTSPDPSVIAISGKPMEDDPLWSALNAGADVGLLGIDLATRRRNRASLRVQSIRNGQMLFDVKQAFGNCPKYIQKRHLTASSSSKPANKQYQPKTLKGFDDRARSMIKRADTFFVASSTSPLITGNASGADISHRGGRPGFIKMEENSLLIPDFAGNRLFNTFGNLLVNPLAGLLLIDFESGDLLMMTGRTEIFWANSPEVNAFRGAERAWRFMMDQGLLFEQAFDMTTSTSELSPFLKHTGPWS